MVGNLLLWSILAAIVLVFIPRAVVVAAIARSGEPFDNRHPRAQQARLEGLGARANAAHQNAFEALILYTPAALAAFVTGVPSGTAAVLAAIFVLARLVYTALYLADRAVARSLVWGIGFAATLALLGFAIAAV